MTTPVLTIVPLGMLSGLSRHNVRAEVPVADVADLIASISAMGVLQPLIIERNVLSSPATPAYCIIEGGRRFTALRAMEDAGTIHSDYPVPVAIVEVGSADAREISLAANVIRRDLHPVEEFEAFARLAADGFAVETIAANFGRPVRFVRQRLALDRLSPRVRQLWRDGKLSAEIAAEFTQAPDHASQDAFVDNTNLQSLQAWAVKSHFRADGGVPANRGEAVYVGLYAYQAAGGRIDDNLFEDFSLLLDPPILRQLARDKMMAEGTELLDRYGFGTCLLLQDIERFWTWQRLPVAMTDTDKQALEAIDTRESAAMAAFESEHDLDDEAQEDPAAQIIATFEAERAELNKRAIMRGSTADQRAQAAIVLSIDHHDGRLVIEYGCVPPTGEANNGGTTTRPSTAEATEPAPASPIEKKPGKAALECIDEARTAVFAKLIADRPNLAILIATAALTARANRSPVRLQTTARNGHIRDLPATSFALAATNIIAMAGKLSPREHLMSAFAQAVAASIVMAPGKSFHYDPSSGPADETETAAVAMLLREYCGEAYSPALCGAFNYAAYFAAAPRDAALRAIEDCGGDINAARKHKKDALAEAATILARDKAWLPNSLRPFEDGKEQLPDFDEMPAPTLVDAMADAIAADAQDEPTAEAAPIVPDAPAIEPLDLMLGQFLDQHRARDTQAKVKAADFYNAFVASPFMSWPAPPTIQAVGNAVAKVGIESKRLSKGIHYLGFRLVDLVSPRPVGGCPQ
ncbi:ParB/RepB/Spo0J family partition protein [Lichenihabitans psoromatis]|uniref:ParB/RepB/Spo0J family partition protein n=1 Tax=Lichenihabitans psoromatis TaxID=2528642 RepID=UPI0013F1760C|nr:ParB/Srx family N-terminal domain-containing protein [Lichenihabitans psoromatis]